MKILAVANQKGGTAKTTTVAALAQAATRKGVPTLAVDLDPQGNLSFFLGADTARTGTYEIMMGEPAASSIQKVAGGPDIIPASWNLQTITSSRGSAHRLRAALEPVKDDYGLIILDTPPTAGELQYNALMACDTLIIPLQADIVGLQGLYQMHATARQIQQSNQVMQIAGYILTRHNDRSTLARQMETTIERRAAEMGLQCLGAIREAVAIREAQTLQRNLYEYAPTCKPALDYMGILTRLQ